jgi:hypothetical protein
MPYQGIILIKLNKITKGVNFLPLKGRIGVDAALLVYSISNEYNMLKYIEKYYLTYRSNYLKYIVVFLS